ncbi:hypothetical protein [Luteolibacter soli]|uniref:Uncharacterized protein n=1 Tax=Luteolibacter soli TaxID=3135280 RepID=A0ABU9AXI6_9BACT
MIRLFLLPLISFFVLPSSALAEEITDSIEVGGRVLRIPAPGGFVRCDGVNAEWDKVMASMQAPANRMLVTYGSHTDQEAIRAGTPADYSKNFNIQVISQLEAKEIGTDTFAGIRDQTSEEVKSAVAKVEKEVNKTMAEGSRKISDQLGVDTALSISDTAMLGVFQEDAQSFGFTMALKLKVSTPKGTEDSKSVVAAMMQPVNGRLLLFYATMPYLSENDRKEAETSVKAWADAVFAANPQVKGPPARPGLFDGVGRSGLIGAIVGGLLGVIFMVKKKITG